MAHITFHATSYQPTTHDRASHVAGVDWRTASGHCLSLLLMVALSLIFITGCANIAKTPAPASLLPNHAITGTISFVERTVLPVNSILEATLEEVAGTGGPGKSISSTRQPVAGVSVVTFSIPFAEAQIIPGRRYAVRAQVLVNGQLLFVSGQTAPVLATLQDKVVTMALQRPVSLSSPTTAQAAPRAAGRAPGDIAERVPPTTAGEATKARVDPQVRRREAQSRAQTLAEAKAARRQAEAEARAQNKAMADAQARAETQARAEAQARAEQARADAVAQAKAQAEARSLAQVQANAQTNTEIRARALAQARAQSENEASARAQAQAQAQASAAADARALAEAGARDESQAKAEAAARALANAQANEKAPAQTAAAPASVPLSPTPVTTPTFEPLATATQRQPSTPAPVRNTSGTAAAAMPSAETAILRGLFRVTADMGTFDDCASGAQLPVSKEREYFALEGPYLRLFASGGSPSVLVTVSGRALLRPGPRDTALRNTLVVDGFLSMGGDVCPSTAAATIARPLTPPTM